MVRTSSCACSKIGAGIGGFDLQLKAVSQAAEVEVGGERNDDEVVLILSQHGADPLERADHRELLIFSADDAAQRVLAGEELIHDAIAHQADGGRVAVLLVGEIASAFHGPSIDIGHVRRMAVERGVVQLVVAIAQAERGTDGCADVFAVRAQVDDGLQVFGHDVLVALRLHQYREIGDGEGQAGNAKDVGAEVGHLLLNVKVSSLHDGHHADQGGDTHREPEDGERGAQLMRTDGTDREREVVGYVKHAATL